MPKMLSRKFRDVVPINDHIEGMKASSIGTALLKFRRSYNIVLRQEDNMPNGAIAAYNPLGNWMGVGQLLYGENISAAILGHEIRHGQQHVLSHELAHPKNIADYILFHRFMEADARAIQFGMVLQLMDSFGIHHDYSYYMQGLDLKVLDPERKLLGEGFKNVSAICASPQRFKQAMRHAFGKFFLDGLSSSYDSQIIMRIKASSKRDPMKPLYYAATAIGVAALPFNPLASVVILGTMGQRFQMCRLIENDFSAAEPDPEYPQKLAQALGVLQGGFEGNYLTDTNGPEFNSEYYTRMGFWMENTLRKEGHLKSEDISKLDFES